MEADVARRTNLERKQEPKTPFQVIPQLTLKVRFLSFGKEQILELLKLLIGNPDVQKLFSYDDLPSIKDRTLVDIEKKQRKIQSLQVACDRLYEFTDTY